MQEQEVWDPLTRVWHWLLAIAVIAGWLLGRFMDFDTIQWHFYVGYVVLGLMGFRLIWGFIGPKPVRWGTLFKSTSNLPAYLMVLGKRHPSGDAGHSPLGAVASLVLILVVSSQAASGLFIESIDFFDGGPLNGYLGSAITDWLGWLHHRLADAILVLVILHLSAMGFYLIWKKENLVRPMITGRKWVESEED